jgi:Flp pilus assembly protein TadD
MLFAAYIQEITMTPIRPLLATLTFAAFCAVSGLPALAAGTGDGSSGTASAASYADAASLIKAGNYADAKAMLKNITAAEPKNADAWNLLGFSSRKSGDLKGAGKAYAKALKLNPVHLGALEYQGEMFIELGEVDSARANLAKLKAACGSCEEMRDLEKALKAVGA